jgi:HTH-type transcriptional regulator / antitoxin HipB
MEQVIRSPKQAGEALRRQRNARGLNQTGLADLAGLRQESVSKIETGNPGTRFESIFALLAALDLEFIVRKRTTDSAKKIEDTF